MAKYPKLWDGASPVGEAKVRQLQKLDAPFVRASGPGFASAKEGDYLEVRGEACDLYLESGIVDLKAGGALDPNLTQPAVYHKTDYVAAAGTGMIAGGGRLHLPQYHGKGLADGAPSVAFKHSDDAFDAEVRKVIAWHVPSSMFTGRTKLYVQSLYGSDLHRFKLAQGSGDRPYLTITTQAREDALLPAIPIATGTGVYLDPATCEHWLINVVSDRAYLYRLVPSPCARQLRPRLKSTKLSLDEKLRLEAYILSHSIPTPAPVQVVTFETTPTDSMGYSWHWNWSGNTCDLVDVVEFLVRPGAYGFRSTHYRLTFAINEAGVFTVERTVVDGPSDWSVPKNANVIAYPDWTVGELVKAGNIPSGIADIAQSGRVYAFYAGDELKVVSYEGSPISGSSARESSPPYFGGLYWTSPLSEILRATESGETSGNGNWDGVSHTFSCDGITVGGENSIKQKDRVVGTWVGRTTGDTPVAVNQLFPPYPAWKVGLQSFDAPTYNTAGTVVSMPGDWNETVDPTGTWSYGYAYIDHWTRTADYYDEVNAAFSLIVIPYMDAQAVYLSGETMVRKTGTSHIGTRRGDSTNVIDAAFRFGSISGPDGDMHHKYYSIAINSTTAALDEPLDTDSPIEETVHTPQSCQLVCALGTFPATPSDVSPFYTGLDVVSQSWGTVSALHGAVRSESNAIAEGSATWPFYSAFVGWA